MHTTKPSVTLKKTLIASVFVSGLGAFFLFGGEQWLSLESLKENRELLLDYAAEHYGLVFLLWSVFYCAATAFSLPGGAVLSLATGLVFGRWVGTGLIILAATAGALLVFLAARYLFAEAAQRRLRQNKMGAKLIQGFDQNAFHYLLFLRLVPLFPFWLVNLVPAFTSIKTRTYLLATLLGIAPGSFVFANLGQFLGHIDTLSQLVSPEVLLGLGLLGLFALLPVLIKKLRLKKLAGDL